MRFRAVPVHSRRWPCNDAVTRQAIPLALARWTRTQSQKAFQYEWCAAPSYRTQPQQLFGEVTSSGRVVANVGHGVVVTTSSALVGHRLYVGSPTRSSTRLIVPDMHGTDDGCVQAHLRRLPRAQCGGGNGCTARLLGPMKPEQAAPADASRGMVEVLSMSLKHGPGVATPPCLAKLRIRKPMRLVHAALCADAEATLGAGAAGCTSLAATAAWFRRGQ
jgi:hypothetical protein